MRSNETDLIDTYKTPSSQRVSYSLPFIRRPMSSLWRVCAVRPDKERERERERLWCTITIPIVYWLFTKIYFWCHSQSIYSHHLKTGWQFNIYRLCFCQCCFKNRMIRRWRRRRPDNLFVDREMSSLILGSRSCSPRSPLVSEWGMSSQVNRSDHCVVSSQMYCLRFIS